MMITRTYLLAFLVLSTLGQIASADDPKPVPLWKEGAPGALGTATGDEFSAGDVPTLTTYLPAPGTANGASIVVCPGGGYGFLATEHEGKAVAEWANSLGITAFVLKYRISKAPSLYKHPRMLEDAQRAIRTVRSLAKAHHLDPHRVAIIGFSAGGHLASTAATHFDQGDPQASDPIEREGCRPDLAILVYPVIAIGTPYGHTGSLKNLLGESPSKELVDSLSNEKQVTKETPPTFLAHTNEDKGVPAENSILFALALRKAGVPVELHLFEKGQHGLGLGTGWGSRIKPEPSFQPWPKLCATWLEGRGFLKAHGTQADSK